jgi:hypothetical protein
MVSQMPPACVKPPSWVSRPPLSPAACAKVKNGPEIEIHRSPLPAQERPVVFQIFDSDPPPAGSSPAPAGAAPFHHRYQHGLFRSTVSGRGAGAGLLRTPLKVARIFRRLTRALEVPVTGKIRLGWDDDSRESPPDRPHHRRSGGALIAVHGRTKKQKLLWRGRLGCHRRSAPGSLHPGDCQRRYPHPGGYRPHVKATPAAPRSWSAALPSATPGSSLTCSATSPPRSRRARHPAPPVAQPGFHMAPARAGVFRKHASRYISPYPLPGALRQRLLTVESVHIAR